MRVPIFLFWKKRGTIDRGKKGAWTDWLIERLIYEFQYIKLKKQYFYQGVPKKDLKENAEIVHVGVYFPDNDTTYDMYGTYKFPFTFGGGARKRKGLKGAHIYVPFAEELDQVTQDRLIAAFEKDVEDKVPYNFPQILVLAIVFCMLRIFRVLNWVPFEDVIFGERCISWIEIIFKRFDIDLVPHSHEEMNATGELLFYPKLSKNRLLSWGETVSFIKQYKKEHGEA
jgi:hypothetical protein